LAPKEAKACIKINKLLEESGWRFFYEEWASLVFDISAFDGNVDAGSICELFDVFQEIYGPVTEDYLIFASGQIFS